MLASAASLASWLTAVCLSGPAIAPSCMFLSLVPPNGRVKWC